MSHNTLGVRGSDSGRNAVGRLYDELTIFGGNSNHELTDEICEYIGIPRGRAEVFKFSNDNTTTSPIDIHASHTD